MAEILTKQQRTVLQLLASTPLAQQFYFSGGTALSHYYLQHRLSEDLDFFAEQEFEPSGVTAILKSLQSQLGYSTLDYQSKLNRNLYFLHFPDNTILKLEFTYYPFTQVEPPTPQDGLLIDSAIDIATNKLFTIAQQPRGRDYYDLYALIQKYGYQIEQLRMLAKQKFDWHIDPLQLASRLNEVDQHVDDPILVKAVNQNDLIAFFREQALQLSSVFMEA
jgi:predicted nucleotidyltransferase component of viral defense system